MSIRSISLCLAAAYLAFCTGCDLRTAAPPGGSAAIFGSIVPTGASGKYATAAQLGCPDVVVTLNDVAVNIELNDDCTFLIDDVQPAAAVVLRIEVADLGVAGTVELTNVGAGELIEVLVEADDESLTVSVLRRAVPDAADELPLVISRNNVTILIPAGVYDQTLTVDGNNFILVGEAGEGCDDSGWSVITGDVIILKNNATFRNIRFEGSVEVHGNNTNFINSCLGSELVIFGHNTDFDDDEGDDDDEDDDSEDVNVTLRDDSVTPASASAPAGHITFQVFNAGAEDHEFLVIKTDLCPDALPTEANGSYQENGPGTELLDEIELIHPGQSANLTLELEAGNYVLICNRVEVEDNGEIVAHYSMEMRAAFVVSFDDDDGDDDHDDGDHDD